jgi:hypothetical protein
MTEQTPGGQQPAPAYTQQNYGPYVPEPPATSKATLALVLGIVGLTVCPGAASIPAWIIGHEAVKEIDSSNGQLGGRSMAMAGKITGIVGTALAALGILAVGAIFLFSAVLFSSVSDCTGSGNDSSFSFHC